MGAIQNSLNQILASTLGAGFVVTQSPGVKQFVEKREAAKTLEKALGATDILKQKRAAGELTREEFNAAMTQAGQEASALTKKVSTTPGEYAEGLALQQTSLSDVEAKPKTVQDIMAKYPQAQMASDVLARQEQALEAKRGVKNAVKQRRSFLEAMKKERVSFGKGDTTFGELPTNIQKQIASTYSKSERKKVMDEYYGKE